MSGTTAKITGLVSTGGNALAAGATLQTKWNAPSGAPEAEPVSGCRRWR